MTRYRRSSFVHLLSLATLAALASQLVACVDDDVELDEMTSDDPAQPGVESRTITVEAAPGHEGPTEVGPVSTEATASLQIRARKGVYWKYCTAYAYGVTYDGSGQLTYQGKVTCDSTMSSIGMKVATYAKKTSTGSSYYHHGTDGGTLSNKSSRTVYDNSLCSGRNQVWWGGHTQFSIKFPAEWYPLAENGITVSGTTATGTVTGSFTAYNCSPYGW